MRVWLLIIVELGTLLLLLLRLAVLTAVRRPLPKRRGGSARGRRPALLLRTDGSPLLWVLLLLPLLRRGMPLLLVVVLRPFS